MSLGIASPKRPSVCIYFLMKNVIQHNADIVRCLIQKKIGMSRTNSEGFHLSVSLCITLNFQTFRYPEASDSNARPHCLLPGSGPVLQDDVDPIDH